MGVSMIVSLYTSRIVLMSLGLEDYGIYNVVGSVIVAFAFLQTPITSSIQRFLNYELGANKGNVNSVMNQSFLIFAILSAFLFVIIEIAGVWYINNKMSLPTERLDATHWAFQLSLISFCISLLKTPYGALIVAHERMSYYAYVSIAEVVLKLGNALSLEYLMFDKLILFSTYQLLVTILITIVTIWYCNKQFHQEIILKKVKDWKQFKDILSFSGWSLFSGVASMTATHGVNLLLNAFFGVVVNAAMGVANQVNATVYQFVTNFQKAFNPQIVKLYATGNLTQMCILVARASKFSYLLLFMLVCPLLFNLEYILVLWLKNPPEGTRIFCIYLMIWQLLESLMAPMWTSVNATGHIKKYHLTMNPIILSVILFSYIAFVWGMPAYYALIIKCTIDVVLLCVRILFVKNMIGFNVSDYLLNTIVPLTYVTIISVGFMLFFFAFFESNLVRLIVGTALYLVVYFVSTYRIALSPQERLTITNMVVSKIANSKR